MESLPTLISQPIWCSALLSRVSVPLSSLFRISSFVFLRLSPLLGAPLWAQRLCGRVISWTSIRETDLKGNPTDFPKFLHNSVVEMWTKSFRVVWCEMALRLLYSGGDRNMGSPWLHKNIAVLLTIQNHWWTSSAPLSLVSPVFS